MLFGLASIVLDTGLELSFWIIKSSVVTIYNGIYIWKYGTEETTQEQLNKLISVEIQNQNILKETLNRFKNQEIELTRLRKKNKLMNNELDEDIEKRNYLMEYDQNIDKNLKLLDKFVILDQDDYHL